MRPDSFGRAVSAILLVMALALVWWPAGSGSAFPAPPGSAPGHPGSDSPAAPTQEAPCASEEARQFDFWIGEWDVTAGDRSAGRNRISSILGGCALLEEYTATDGGYEGKSFNIYDNGAGEWHQSWVDNQGLLLRLRGGLEDGRMVLSGERRARDGGSVIDRITWSPSEDGTVRQTWKVSRDDAKTWNTVFDGTYTRVN